MTNGERFKTVEERIKEFKKFCKERYCEGCSCKETPTGYTSPIRCMLVWLDLEYKEELKPCPFCENANNLCVIDSDKGWYIVCGECCCRTDNKPSKDLAITAWNRRAK